jgi:outer membrane protein TolC
VEQQQAKGTARVALTPIEIRLLSGDRHLPVDYPSAIRLAAAKSLDILQARARLEERLGERVREAGDLLPSVSAALQARHIDGETQANFGEQERVSFSTILPGVIVELRLNPGESIFELLAAHRRVEAGRLREEQVTQEALAQVAALYFRLLRAHAEVNIAAAAVDTAGELARLAHDRLELGVGLEVDSARAEARVAREELARAAAEERFRAASVDLAEALLLDPQVVLFPTEREVRQAVFVGTERDLETLLSVAVERRPALGELAREIDAAGDARSAAWWGGFGPEIYGAFEESAIGRSFDVDNRQIYGGFIGWRLSAASIGEVRAASARVEQARISRERVERSVQSEVVKARDGVLTAEERLSSARKGLVAAEQSLRLSRERFAGGVGLDLEVLEAQEALTAAQTALAAAIVDYDVEQVRLLLALGGATEDGLLAPFAGDAP